MTWVFREPRLAARWCEKRKSESSCVNSATKQMPSEQKARHAGEDSRSGGFPHCAHRSMRRVCATPQRRARPRLFRGGAALAADEAFDAKVAFEAGASPTALLLPHCGAPGPASPAPRRTRAPKRASPNPCPKAVRIRLLRRLAARMALTPRGQSVDEF